MEGRIKKIELRLRYILSLASLSTMVFCRIRIGQNVFAPWNNKPFGKGKGFFYSTVSTRLFIVALLYLWVRLFGFLYGFFHPGFTLGKPFKAFFTNNIGALSGMEAFFPVYSYLVVAASLTHMLVSYEITKKGSRPSPTSLGDSLVFGYLTRRENAKAHIDKYFIWGVLDPALVAVIGLVFLIFGYGIHALFFLISALSTAYQGHVRRMKHRRDEEIFEDQLRSRKETINHAKELKDRAKQDGLDKENRGDFAVEFEP